MSDSEITRTIRGIVIPTDWNDDGQVRSVAIATYREQKYDVVDNARCRELLTLVSARVVVYGVIRGEGARMAIEIGHFCRDMP